MKIINAIDSPLLKEKNKITIYKGVFSLEAEEKSYCAEGEIYMILNPKVAIKFKGETQEINDLIREDDLELSIPEMLPTRGTVTSLRNGKIFEGIIFEQIKNSENPYVDRYFLYVVNYTKFIGYSVNFNERKYKGGMYFEIEGWSIEMQKRHDYKDIFNVLGKSIENSITHIIEIKRIDGEKFKKNDASKICEVLKWVFNITTGRHISMPIEIGELDKELVYKNYQKQLTSVYRSRANWFPKHKGKVLEELFYQIYDKFDDSYLKKVIGDVILQYVEILETTFLENKIIHSQIALEKLSYVLLTQQSPQIISNTKFKKNSFSENLECILEKLNVEAKLKEEYTIFESDFESGPHLLAQYRNHIAHPKPKPIFENYSIEKKYLILELSIYYVELLMLYLVGYNEVYFNRLNFPEWQGNYEELPWNLENDGES